MGLTFSHQHAVLSKVDLTQFLVHAIRKVWPDLSIEIIHPNEPNNIFILIKTNDDTQLQCSPDHIYDSYLQDPTQLNSLCDNFTQALHEIINPDTNAPTTLIPVLQNQTWLNDLEKERSKTEEKNQSPTACMPLVADLCIVFALCRNQTCLFATEQLLSEFLDVELPHQINLIAIEEGVRTLRDQLSDIQLQLTPAGYRVTLDHFFDTSLIMIYEDWEHLANIEGSPIFALIARDYLMLADSSKPEQVEQLKALAAQAFQEATYPLSNNLFTFKDQQLVLYSKMLH